MCQWTCAFHTRVFKGQLYLGVLGKFTHIGSVFMQWLFYQAAAVALSSLIHALDELDMVAVVRYVYDKRANPQVGMAFPYIKDTYEVKPIVLSC